MKKPSRFLRLLGAAGLLISLLAATVAPVAAQPEGLPDQDGLEWLFDLNDGAFRTGDNAIYYPWVANGDDFGLGPSQTSISVQNLEDVNAEIGIFVGDGAGDYTLVTSAFLSPYAAKTFDAGDLGIAEGSGAPVAVLALNEFEFTGTPDEDFPDVTPGEALVETEVELSKPAGVEGDFTQVDACVVNDGDGNPVGFVVAAAFTFDGVSYEAGDVFAMAFTSGDLQEILEDAQDGGELINPFGGLNDDADCDDEGIAGELGETIVSEVAIGGVAKQAVMGANLPMTSEADTAVSGYNALNGSEVFQFDEWYLPIVQTNCGPGGCWDTVVRVANLDSVNNAVTIRFFPADDGSGSLHTGFQVQELVNGGATWSVNLGDLVPDGWVGSAHIYSDGAVFAMADRYKVGYNMWITNTGSSADFENLAQVDGANGRYALFAPHVLLDYFGWNTGINVANLVNSDNNISIQYFNTFGNATQVLNQRLAAHGMTYFYDPSVGAQDNNNQGVPTDPNAGVVGSAIIWSDSPVAAAVDATKYPETDPNGGEDVFQATSYSATQNIFTWQAVPLVQKGDPATGMGDTSGINIMNPNAEAVTANVYWVNPSGFLADNFGVSSVTIPGFANGFVYTLWQHNLPNGFVGAAQVVASAPVAAVSANVNYEVDGDGSAIFNAFNPCGFFRVSGECGFGDPFEPGGQSVTKTFIVDDGDDEDEVTVGDAEGIAGVDFSIVSTSDDFPFQRDGVSGTDGSATFSNIPVGTYELIVNDVPGDFEVPTNPADQFVVTEGADVTLINELELAQGFEKTVCVGDFDEEAFADFEEAVADWEADEPDPADFDTDEAFEAAVLDWLAEEPGVDDFFFCSDTNLAGVQVVVFEVIGLDVELFPVVDLDPVFVGETGADGTVAGDLPSGDYILCLYKDLDGAITTAPGGEEVEVDLFPEIVNLIPCFNEDPDDFFSDLESDAGDYFVVESGVVTELENPVLLEEGILNVLVYEEEPTSTAGVFDQVPVAGVELCIDGPIDGNLENDIDGCATTGEDGMARFPGALAGNYDLTVDSGDVFLVVESAEGGVLTVDVNTVTMTAVNFDYDPTEDVVQDGVMDDVAGEGTFDLEIVLDDAGTVDKTVVVTGTLGDGGVIDADTVLLAGIDVIIYAEVFGGTVAFEGQTDASGMISTTLFPGTYVLCLFDADASAVTDDAEVVVPDLPLAPDALFCDAAFEVVEGEALPLINEVDLLGQLDVGWSIGATYPIVHEAFTYCLYEDGVAVGTGADFEGFAVECAFLPANALVSEDVGIFFANVPDGTYFIAWENVGATVTGQTTNSLTYDQLMDETIDGELADIVPAVAGDEYGTIQAGSFFDFLFVTEFLGGTALSSGYVSSLTATIAAGAWVEVEPGDCTVNTAAFDGDGVLTGADGEADFAGLPAGDVVCVEFFDADQTFLSEVEVTLVSRTNTTTTVVPATHAVLTVTNWVDCGLDDSADFSQAVVNAAFVPDANDALSNAAGAPGVCGGTAITNNGVTVTAPGGARSSSADATGSAYFLLPHTVSYPVTATYVEDGVAIWAQNTLLNIGVAGVAHVAGGTTLTWLLVQ